MTLDDEVKSAMEAQKSAEQQLLASLIDVSSWLAAAERRLRDGVIPDGEGLMARAASVLRWATEAESRKSSAEALKRLRDGNATLRLLRATVLLTDGTDKVNLELDAGSPFPELGYPAVATVAARKGFGIEWVRALGMEPEVIGTAKSSEGQP